LQLEVLALKLSRQEKGVLSWMERDAIKNSALMLNFRDYNKKLESFLGFMKNTKIFFLIFFLAKMKILKKKEGILYD